MRKVDILRRMVLDLEETLTPEQPELLLIVLAGQVERNDLVTIVNSLGDKLRGLGLGEGGKVMFDEDFVIDPVVLLEGDVTHRNLWLDKG